MSIKLKLLPILSQLRPYWKSRYFTARIRFFIDKQYFGFRSSLREERSNIVPLRELWRITRFQLFVAILFSLFLLKFDPYIAALPGLKSLKIPAEDDYLTLFATVSGIGGVFIGLYYAAISMVGSAIYSRVPNNIRDLLARERVGNVYMRYLAFLTFVCLGVMGLRLIGFPRILVAVPIVTLMAGIGIIAFVKLGQRAFYLFDPTRLSYVLFEDLWNLVRNSTALGFRWNDPSFQNHANKQARQTIDTLKTLADITSKEPNLNGKPFVDLTKNTLGFLINYEEEKQRIPSESRWYEQKYKHRDWYRTEDTTVSLAHQTSVTLQPEVVHNYQWVECELYPIILKCIEVNLDLKRPEFALQLVSYLEYYLKTISQQSELVNALSLLDQIADLILSNVCLPQEKLLLQAEVLENLALCERLSAIPIAVLLAYGESISDLNRESISKSVSEIKWQKHAQIYRAGFKAFILPRIEWFHSRLVFELRTENKIVSPNWYQTELVAQVVAEKTYDNIQCLVYKIAERYEKWFETANKAKHPWLAAAVLSRELEYWNKVRYHLNNIIDIWKSLYDNRHLSGLRWPELDENKVWRELSKRERKTIEKMAKQSTILSVSPRQDDFPDFGGQFLHALGEATFYSLLEGDESRFKMVYSSYHYGCLAKFDQLRPKANIESLQDWRTKQEIKVAVAPLMDLIELSGYAKLLSDFHARPSMWSEVVSTWDAYLNNDKQPPSLSLFSAAISLTEMDFEIPHRSVLRTSWKQAINHRFSSLPRKQIYHHHFVGESIPIHDSALVRIFAGDRPYGTLYDGIDIFIDLYFRKRPESNELDFGRRRRGDLEEMLLRDEERYQNSVNPDESDHETESKAEA